MFRLKIIKIISPNYNNTKGGKFYSPYMPSWSGEGKHYLDFL